MNASSTIHTISRPGWSLRRLLASFAAACFIGAFLTDLTYAKSMNFIWANFSAWLLAFGMIMSGLAIAAVVLAAVVRKRSTPVIEIVGGALVTALSLFNNFVHSRDGYTSVVPLGLTLSAIVVAIIVVTGLLIGGAAPWLRTRTESDQ